MEDGGNISTADPIAHCVICGHPGRGDATPFHMTHGIAVWLCPVHRTPPFLRRRRGRVFTERLHAAWLSAGRVTSRHLKSLESHRRRMTPDPPKRDRPGSYAWPQLRETAEARFAAGEEPDAVIRDLRGFYERYVAKAPSVRTMRRWHTEARWLHVADGPEPAFRKPSWPRRPRVSRWPNLQYDTSLAVHPFGWLLLLWLDDRPESRRKWHPG